VGEYELIGHTLDDAAGEAFDKVAKMCGLGYPGGVQIDKLARMGNPTAFSFPRPMLQHKGYDFSFSGIKTAVLTKLKQMEGIPEGEVLADLAASFQAGVVEVLHQKTLRAARAYNLKRIVVAGGVACNSGLRKAFADSHAMEDMQAYFPSPLLCADNAAMLAVAGEFYLRHGVRAGLDLNACSTWALDQAGAELLELAS
jgi:N6-L-threonylcarbamoyladenine synthase